MAESRLKVAILIVSDTASKDASADKCAPALHSVFDATGSSNWEIVETKIVPDNVDAISEFIRRWTDSVERVANCVITSGGTGFATKDVTPEVSTYLPYMGVYSGGLELTMFRLSRR
jgi:gephyrin